MSEDAVQAGNLGDSSPRDVGRGADVPTARSAQEYCDECGGLTSDPRVQGGRVLCGLCAREERLQQTDHRYCKCDDCNPDI